MGFEWFVKYCLFSYLLKLDDDVFVNMFGFMDFLSKFMILRKKFYIGNVMVGSVVLRNGRYGVLLRNIMEWFISYIVVVEDMYYYGMWLKDL